VTFDGVAMSALLPTRTRAFLVALILGTEAIAQIDEVGPPLGRLVDLGGRKLHLHCTGNGSPTVVIEAGASSFAIDFALVQSQVAHIARVCSYDRAGMGWSDARSDVETPIRVIRDLRTLLDAAVEKGPSSWWVPHGVEYSSACSRLSTPPRLRAWCSSIRLQKTNCS
jgi:hypothetical protein